MTTWRVPLLLLIALPTSGFGADQPRLSRKVSVPSSVKAAERSPNGETNGVRYTTAYEAYWWNCVLVRAESLEGRCPSACSGNDAATLGCADGSVKARNDIDELVLRFSGKRVREYLRTLAQGPAGRLKIKPYFSNGPQAEKPPE